MASRPAGSGPRLPALRLRTKGLVRTGREGHDPSEGEALLWVLRPNGTSSAGCSPTVCETSPGKMVSLPHGAVVESTERKGTREAGNRYIPPKEAERTRQQRGWWPASARAGRCRSQPRQACSGQEELGTPVRSQSPRGGGQWSSSGSGPRKRLGFLISQQEKGVNGSPYRVVRIKICGALGRCLARGKSSKCHLVSLSLQ